MPSQRLAEVAIGHGAKEVYTAGTNKSYIRAEFATCSVRRIPTGDTNPDGTVVFLETDNLEVECSEYLEDSAFTIGGIAVDSIVNGSWSQPSEERSCSYLDFNFAPTGRFDRDKGEAMIEVLDQRFGPHQTDRYWERYSMPAHMWDLGWAKIFISPMNPRGLSLMVCEETPSISTDVDDF